MPSIFLSLFRRFIAPVCLMAATAIFFFPTFISGRTLVPLDIIQEYDSFFGQPGISSHNYLLSDNAFQLYPNYSFIHQELSAGRFPLWNPHVLTGMPFFADPTAQVLELTHLFAYLLRIAPLAFPLFSAVITVCLSNLFCYWYFRSIRLNRIVATLGALAFTFSGPFIVWLNYPQTATIIWLPLILACVEHITRHNDRRFVVIGAVAVAFLILAGHPHIGFLALLLALVYAAGRIATCQIKNRLKTSAFIVLFIGIGILISSIQSVPALTLIRESDAFRVGRGYRAQESITAVAANQFMNPRSSFITFAQRTVTSGMLFFNPLYYGTPLARDYRHPSGNPYANFTEVTVYVGLLTIILALIAWLLRRNRFTMFWSVVALLGFGLMADLPFINLISYLPLFNKISINRWQFVVAFAVVSLAAAAAQFISDFLGRKIVRGHRLIPGAVVGAITVATFLNLTLTFHNYLTQLPASDGFLRQHPAAATLQDATGPWRTIGLGTPGAGFRAPLIPNLSMVFGTYDVRGYNPLTPRDYTQWADTFLVRRGSFTLADALPDVRILNLMGVRYLLCASEDCTRENISNIWPEAYADDHIKILQNPSVLPRSFIAYVFTPIRNADDAIAQLRLSDFDTSSRITIHGGTVLTLSSTDPNKILPAQITSYQPNKVSIIAKSDRPGVLVLTDRYDSGWRATVNGKATPVLQIDAIFRGVVIPSGDSTVTFRYFPPYYLLATTGTILGILTLIAWSWKTFSSTIRPPEKI